LNEMVKQNMYDGIRQWIRSLTGKLVLLILTGILISAVIFGILNVGIGKGMEVYFARSSYLEDRENASVRELQAYVREKRLTPMDSQKLWEWVKGKRVIYLEVYRNNRMLYSSRPSMDGYSYEDAAYPDYENRYHEVAFEDGKAEVYLYGFFDYQFYVYALVMEILFCFFVFLAIFIYGVKNRIRYIQKIQSEICVMEGGCMEKKFTISGTDELAELARGLEQMRLSLKQNMEDERKLRQANHRLITGIAHDLRTPLTSLTVYIEILKSDICKDDKMRRYYLDKIMSKAVQMKELSDILFESCQIKKEGVSDGTDKLQNIQDVFMDYLSEMTVYICSRGFEMETDLEWRPCEIIVRMDCIPRIIDNLSANLVKYADEKKPVWLRTLYEDDWAGIEVCNRIKKCQEYVESTKVGLENIKGMMQNMNGVCLVSEDGEMFRVKLLFPIRYKPEGGEDSGSLEDERIM
jgi:signal transduction histidine kinase